MPPKRNRVQGGNARSRASAVPQGDRRRRARPESEDVTDQPAATRRRVEEARQPEWTMRSTVEGILLEGSTLKSNMGLNEFLRSYLGGTAAVDEDHNVTMQAFVRRPNAYVQDQQLLEGIINLTEYQELKIELDNRKILLEAINKLRHEGVVSLEQWRDYEGKDTVTPFPKAKINAVLTQVQREAKREAEERLRREEEKMQRRLQEMKFTISTTIEEVLFKGEFRYKEMKLNDFLLLRFGGKGVVDTNENVLLEEFFKEPARYIHDAGVLGEIRTTGAYLRIEGAVRDEMDKDEDVCRLKQAGVSNLQKWSEAAEQVKESVHEITKSFLDAAFEEASNPTATVLPIKMEGYYESVYNARWHHVVEVPDDNGIGMKVEEGKPKQSWTYKEVGETLEKDNGMQQSGAVRSKLMVLTSDKAWPYTWKGDEFIRDCYVNCEVERVWQIVLDDLTEWFGTHVEEHFTPERHLVIGTPGIGKSMNAGSYLLYQLLQCDVEKLPVVLYVIGNEHSFLKRPPKR
ncbi:putative retrotransposon hot spot protein (RHS) [Trypanosoma cruzi]|uniref:Putative retrotransposon hot spot protein (RHS) n=1 Tax=Trypanosoma cruzi TaxID=5693 RepID=A0A2V2WF25_TRYCR|nr:putative retrotransposon hot spot protein (RHS) [Trypanosoma cruzi]